MKRVLLFCFWLLLGFNVVEAQVAKKSPLKVALSLASPNYVNWVHRADGSIETIDLKEMSISRAVKLLESCSGLILTGGEDVVPAYYGEPGELSRCSVNPSRDSFELALIRKALRLKIPIVGICRGQQLLNVSQGGSLIVDIPADYGKSVVHQQADWEKCFHNVKVMKGSLLGAICRADSGMVTSNHHQAVKKIAPGFKATAFANDGIIESIQWANPAGKSFLIAVQWHPERMDTLSPLSMPIARRFVQEAYRYRAKKQAATTR